MLLLGSRSSSGGGLERIDHGRLRRFRIPNDRLAIHEGGNFGLEGFLLALEGNVFLVRCIRVHEVDLRHIAIAVEFTELAGFIPHDVDGVVELRIVGKLAVAEK